MLTEGELPDLEDLRRRRTSVRRRIEELQARLPLAPEVEAMQIKAALAAANRELASIAGELALLVEYAPMLEASAPVPTGDRS